MLLTGKSKEDFLYWNHHVKQNDWGYLDIESNSLNIGFGELDESLQYSIIIEWFDSVGIYIEVKKSINMYWLFNINLCGRYCNMSALEPMQDSRHEATKQAIIKSNQIYNNK